MRKLVWCGAAVMVAGAVAVFMAARHAADHPDSFWGRCTAAVADLGFRCNPFVAVGNLMHNENGKQTADGVQAIVAGAVGGMQEGAEECAEVRHDEFAPSRVEERFEPREPPTPIEAVQEPEVVEPLKVTELMPNERNFDIGEEYAELLPFPMESEEPENGTTEESEPLLIDGPIPAMPPVLDDMPAEEQKPEVGQEQAEVGGEACCDWMTAMLHAAGLIPEMPPTAEEAEVLPMPTPCADDEEQGEGVEELPGDEAPPMPQNSYDYHRYHHDSCPYMGCPYPYSHSPSMVTPVEPPAEKVRKKKKHHQLDKPAQMESLWQQLFGESFEESEPPMHSGIDTMEFRPSDDLREPPGHNPF